MSDDNVIELPERPFYRVPGFIESDADSRLYRQFLKLIGASDDRVQSAFIVLGGLVLFLAANGITAEEVTEFVTKEMAQQERLADLAEDYGR